MTSSGASGPAVNSADHAEQELRRLNLAAFDSSGVDLNQIDMMLALTPEQRLAVHVSPSSYRAS